MRTNGKIVLFGSQPFTTKLINSNIENFSHQWIWIKEQGKNPLLCNKMPLKNFEDILIFNNSIINKKNNSDILFNELKTYLRNEKKNSGLTNKQLSLLYSNYIGKTKFKDRSVMEHYFEKEYFMIPTKDIYENVLQKTGYFQKPYSYIKSFCPENIFNPQKTKGDKYKSGNGYLKHLDIKIKGGTISEERYPTCTLYFKSQNGLHPTQKPVALFEYLIKTYTNEGDLVLDNCAGSGTTAIACHNLNRNFICIEKDYDYWKASVERLENAQAQCKLF